jgi:hypothetical protein
MTVWTEDRVEAVKRMQIEGYSSAQIAAHINDTFGYPHVTRNAVIGKIGRLGLTGKGPRSRETGAVRINKIKTARAVRRAPPSAPKLPKEKAIDLTPFRTPLNGAGVPFLERGIFQCSWEVGPQTVCGHAVTHPRFSWCPHHCSIGLVKPERPPREPQQRKQGINEAAYR